jgi:hypothetical protein
VTYQRGVDFVYAQSTSFAPPGLDAGAMVWQVQDGLNTLESRSEFTQGLVGGLESFFDGVLTGTQPERGSLEFARQIVSIYENAILAPNGMAVDLRG